MDNKRLIESVSAQERLDMIMKGFKPLNPSDIERYRNGEIASMREREEKAKEIFAGVATNLGEGQYRDVMPSVGDYNPAAETEPTVDYRQSLNEDMNDYVSTQPSQINMDEILSFKKPQKRQASNGNSAIYNEGFNNAKNYLNAFVVNLDEGDLKGSYKTRLNVFKALKVSLETDLKYQKSGDNKKLAEYRRGVLAAEKALLQKINN